MPVKKALLAALACLLILLLGLPAGAPAVLAGQADPGPYGAGRQIVTVPRPSGGTFTAQLFYPATSTGNGAPYDGSGAPYPAVTFGHGFSVHPDKYRSTFEHLASHGYLVIAPESYTSPWFPSHQAFANDMRYSLDYLEARNADAGSWLYGQVDTAHFGMAGHSMGGGSSVLAAAVDPRVKALALLAAAETDPSAIAQMPNIGMPVRLLSGNEDGIVDWETNTQAMYDAGRPPRQRQLILGGWHCGFMDSNILFCDSGSLPRAEQLEITRRELVTFFDLYLEPEEGSWREVWGPERADDPRIALLSEPGIGLSPENQAGQGAPGTVLSYELTVTNLDTQATSYTMLAEDDTWPPAPAPWPTSFSPEETPVLASGESVQVTVLVQLPGTPGPEETILVTARSALDGGTRQYATLTSGFAVQSVHVGNIRLKYQVGSGGAYRLTGQVPVLDGAQAPVAGASVTAQWTLPNGQVIVRTAVTAANGVARFQANSRQQGLHILTVLGVQAPGYVYAPEQNLETSEEIMVP